MGQIARALAIAGDNAFTHFNAGLLYFEMEEFDLALSQAHKASAMGLGREDLRERLRAAGKWAEPTVVPADAGASATATATGR